MKRFVKKIGVAPITALIIVILATTAFVLAAKSDLFKTNKAPTEEVEKVQVKMINQGYQGQVKELSDIILEVKDLEVKVNEEVDVNSFVVSCEVEDEECVLTILDKDNKEVNKIDTSKEGEYTFTIKATSEEAIDITKEVKLTIKKEEVKEVTKETKTTETKKNSNTSTSNNSSKSNSNTSNGNSNNTQSTPAPSAQPSQPATPAPTQQNCTRPTENVIFLSQPCDAEKGLSSCYKNDPVYQNDIEKYYHKDRKDTEYWYALDRWRDYGINGTDGFQDPMIDICGIYYGVQVTIRLAIGKCLGACDSDENYNIIPNNPYWDSFTKRNNNIVGEYYVTSRGNVWYWNPNGLSF